MSMVHLNRHVFNSLDEMSLGTTCFEPLIQAFKEVRMRGGDERTFYAGLSEGQQQLFIFRVYYDHVHHSPEELFWWSAYFLAQPLRWLALKSSFRVHGDDEAAGLLEEIESFLTASGYSQSLEIFDVSRSDMAENLELLNSFNDYYDRLQKHTEVIHQRLAQYIRSHPDEFVHLE